MRLSLNPYTIMDNWKYMRLSHNIHNEQHIYMSRVARKPVFGVGTRSDTNRPVQPQK